MYNNVSLILDIALKIKIQIHYTYEINSTYQ